MSRPARGQGRTAFDNTTTDPVLAADYHRKSLFIRNRKTTYGDASQETCFVRIEGEGFELAAGSLGFPLEPGEALEWEKDAPTGAVYVVGASGTTGYVSVMSV